MPPVTIEAAADGSVKTISATVAGSANLGTMMPARDLKTGKIEKLGIPARCDAKTGLLLIGEGPDLGPYVLPGNNYHVYDVPLFWSNVRADVSRREAAWQAGRKAAP
jgi:hypothetical protein